MDFNSLINKQEYEEKIKDILKDPHRIIPDLDTAIYISIKYNIALHPRYLYYWNEISVVNLIDFFEHIYKKLKFKIIENEIAYSLVPTNKIKRTLELLGIEHKLKILPIEQIKSEDESEVAVINKFNTRALLANLGIYDCKLDIADFHEKLKIIIANCKSNLIAMPTEILSKSSEIEIRDKGGSYIGARMGRPEKAKMRKQFNDETKSHGLFPVGAGEKVAIKRFGSDEEHHEIIQNRLKNINVALKTGFVEENFRIFFCSTCNKESIYPKCPKCQNDCEQKYFERYSGLPTNKDNEKAVLYKNTKIDLEVYEKDLRKILGSGVELPKYVKGISATINKHHTTEHICKSFLRAINHVYVNKDGTVRYDMIEMGLTHFRPFEIGTSVEKLKELGYTTDYYGKELKNDNQLVEIFPQDVILPDCSESGDEFASDFVINTGNYIDDLLEKLYQLPRFYNFKNKEDTIGHLLIGLAPHTSAGIVGRIIGYSKTQGCFSHPVWHAAQRRNLDGDENGVMLLLDGLLNSSREFLPDRRGSRTMDVSLVLTAHLYLDQIDDEVHGMDIAPYYPLEFYRANKEYKSPKEVKIEKVEKRINKKEIDEKYLYYKFTHDTTDMNDTIMCSSYKSVPSMKEKMELQLGLAKKIRAVDEHIVSSLIIDKHFMKDIKGNLRKFGMQTFRCTNCGEKYRRPPLIGKCVKCNMASINFTIHEGSIKKYIEPSFKLVREYNVDPYLVESLELANLRIEGVFGKDVDRQKNLSSFFGK